MPSTRDITWYKGHALLKIHYNHVQQKDILSIEEVDELIKEYAGFPKDTSCKDISHEKYQEFKEWVKHYAINVVGLDLDEGDGIKFNW